MYKQCYDQMNQRISNSILRLSDGACIPMHPDNRDYQEYLKWLEAGNEALPPDEVVNA
jgi:hypothetical protein